MKLLIILAFITLYSCNEQAATKKSQAHKLDVKDSLPKEIADEDCDDKAKKVEIIEEKPIDLSGSDTGCSLDEINK